MAFNHKNWLKRHHGNKNGYDAAQQIKHAYAFKLSVFREKYEGGLATTAQRHEARCGEMKDALHVVASVHESSLADKPV
jgi:hypothetical protein